MNIVHYSNAYYDFENRVLIRPEKCSLFLNTKQLTKSDYSTAGRESFSVKHDFVL